METIARYWAMAAAYIPPWSPSLVVSILQAIAVIGLTVMGAMPVRPHTLGRGRLYRIFLWSFAAIGLVTTIVLAMISFNNETKADKLTRNVTDFLADQNRSSMQLSTLNRSLAQQLVSIASRSDVSLDLRAEIMATGVLAWAAGRSAERPLLTLEDYQNWDRRMAFERRDRDTEQALFNQVLGLPIISLRDDLAAEGIAIPPDLAEIGTQYRTFMFTGVDPYGQLALELSELGNEYARKKRAQPNVGRQ